MSNLKKNKTARFKFFIFFVIAIVTISIVISFEMIWGVKRETVTFKKLNTSEQILLNDSLHKITGKLLTIKKITHNEYKNGVKNYVIKLNRGEQLGIESKYFSELNEQFADTHSDTGYYYKNQTLYIVIHDVDYNQINDEEEKKILASLGELSDALYKVFDIN